MGSRVRIWLSGVLTVGLIASATASALGDGEVEATIAVRPVQEQTRKLIRVKAAIETDESITILARGQARARGEIYYLQPKGLREMGPQERSIYRFVTERGGANGLFRALEEGRHPRARLLFRLTDSTGEVDTRVFKRVWLTR